MPKDTFTPPASFLNEDFDIHFKEFHELMANRLSEILLVASPYDAYILEEDGSLATKIINEYRGLNLSGPPRITQAANAAQALAMLDAQPFHLVIAMPHLDDMDVFDLGRRIKARHHELPVVCLAHGIRGAYPSPDGRDTSGIDQFFVWSGDADLLLAIIKSMEDRLNVAADTQRAMVRVLILVEDSPLYASYLLPLIYKEVVRQTQEVIEESLNQEHRLLKMRARPKILLATNYEQAFSLYRQYSDYLFGVISDTRYPKSGKLTADAGYTFLSEVRQAIFDLPLLLISNEPENRALAERIPALFLDKNSDTLLDEIHGFFLNNLGFGDFVFRRPNGSEIARAANLKALEEILPRVPDESLLYHAKRNRFSNWIMARGETALASRLRKARAIDFPDANAIRQFIISHIHALRKWRQKGVVVQFNAQDYDPEISEFAKIGNGSLGGKARGLAFVTNLLRRSTQLAQRYPDVTIRVPQTLTITTEGFDAFVAHNGLDPSALADLSDEAIAKRFVDADMPPWLADELAAYLQAVHQPLSIRSSGLLEDVHHHPFTGLYKTYMVPNNHPDFKVRCRQLITAVKWVYASTWFREPRTFLKGTAYRLRSDQMAVIVQQLVGRRQGEYFYPDISGVAQSQNFYPVAPLNAEDGVARIVLGFGRGIPEGEPSLRFSPAHPQVLPQFSKVEDILANAQQHFWALRLSGMPDGLYFERGVNLEKRHVADAENEDPVLRLASTYVTAENRIRDTVQVPGPRILTFATALKYDTFPLPQLLKDLLTLGREGMGCPVEFEFAVNLEDAENHRGTFNILQMRPMSAGEDHLDVAISETDVARALCYSTEALGHGRKQNIRDIVYVRPDTFDPADTPAIARAIAALNQAFRTTGRTYLLIGPGRWGSFDRWLGIPVKWRDIDAVGAMVELRNEHLKADPSHGSHFFHHITVNGIPYLTVTEGENDHIRWDLLKSLPHRVTDDHLGHVRLDRPLTIKCDGKQMRAVILL
ncbi:Pyruvate phosphate dikinase PEP/pyruvate-binding protein [Desulfosarcina cetonica]|uniref:PEP/pyruvate-binding domain-containing protein n=1 Tax=Desulfosarcina cetonica TaxID=90730 RepID=UPI000A8714B9|nr:PEP/pyruvate-binding domain-containing protein [Desulfosarcina cetonica]VTR67641.1 Pyruvate phosphate dikinase PEP/pyruvate-binding protein [Desulfosarcina cetonica]